MSTLLEFLEKSTKKSIFWWISYFWKELTKEKEQQIDKSWVGIKLNSTYYPKNMSLLVIKEYQFNQHFPDKKENTAIMEYISKEYNKEFKTFKSYAIN